MSGLQILSLIVSLGILAGAIEMLRRRRLREKYAVLWLVVAVGQLVLGVFPGLLDAVAGRLGIADPPNLLAFVAVVFLLGVCAHLSLESSRLEEETRTLAEEVAILRRQVEVLQQEP
ncbi:MAG: DUF2304 domain-containing protein [Euzebya sp.]